MPVVNPLARELVFKVVYYGPGLGGKTSSLQHIHRATKSEHRGRLVSLATPVDRTLYFDFLPIRIPSLRNLSMRLQLFTVPGQVYYNATRRLVLTGADGVVFVADSQEARAEANLESIENLRENLEQHGRSLQEVPHVLQYNKRDLPDLVSIETLEETLNWYGVPSFATVATEGDGIFEALEAITRAVMEDFERRAPEQAAPSRRFEAPEGGLTEALRDVERNAHEAAASRTTGIPIDGASGLVPSLEADDARGAQGGGVADDKAAAEAPWEGSSLQEERAVGGSEPDEPATADRPWSLALAREEPSGAEPSEANGGERATVDGGVAPGQADGALAESAPTPPIAPNLVEDEVVHQVVAGERPTRDTTRPALPQPSMQTAPSPASEQSSSMPEVSRVAPFSAGAPRPETIEGGPVSGLHTLSFAELWAPECREAALDLEHAIAHAQWEVARSAVVRLVDRELSVAEGLFRDGGVVAQPAALTCVLLGMETGRYLRYLNLVRAGGQSSGPALSRSNLLEAYLFALELHQRIVRFG